MGLGKPLLLSLRLWDQLRERIRCLHYSLNTEKVYVRRVRFFIRRRADIGGMQQTEQPAHIAHC